MLSTLRTILPILVMTLLSVHVTDTPASAFRHTLLSVAWQQEAEEFKALSWQTFNIATDQFLEAVQQLPSRTRPAVIINVDDVLFNNTPMYAARLYLRPEQVSATWLSWWQSQQASLMPGAIEYIEKVLAQHGLIFYLSYRPESVRQATIDQLKSQKLLRFSTERFLQANNPLYKPLNKSLIQDFSVIQILGTKVDESGVPDSVINTNNITILFPAVLSNTDPVFPDRPTITKLRFWEPPSYIPATSDMEAFQQLQNITWMQCSAEYPAISQQIYHQATKQLINQKRGSSEAIILDIDGTLLENSPYYVGLVRHQLSTNSKLYNNWLLTGQSATVPGARTFTHHQMHPERLRSLLSDSAPSLFIRWSP